MSSRASGRIALTRWLVGHTRNLLPPLWGSVIARVLGQLLGVALFVVAADALTQAATGQTVPILPLVAGLAGISLVKALLRYLEHYAGHWVAFTALQRLRELFVDRLVPQAPAATQGRAGAELTERGTRDIDRIEVFFAHTLPPAVAAVLVPAVALVWLGVGVDARLALVLAPFVLGVLVAPFAAGHATWHAARRVAARRGQIAAHLGDDVQGIREVLAFDASSRRLAEIDKLDRALRDTRSRAGLGEGARRGVSVVLQGVSLVAVLAVAAASGLPVAHTVAALAVGVALWGPARGVDDFVSGLDAAFAATARVRQIVDATPVVGDPPDPVPLGTGSAISLSDVTFSYPDSGEPALADVSLEIAEHAWTYVVGVSGSGKSTLAGLVLRGWDPDSGVIRVGGTDIRTVALDALRSRVALVSQRPTLLSGTLADNLRLADPDADEARLRDALETAGLDDWVASLPKGLETPVAERGLGVSGGQLQRLALARALVADPGVLILDEALSQLDADTAVLVRTRLAARAGGLTIVEITHRADLIGDEAPVVVLDAGRLAQSGRAGDLRAAEGPFTRLE